MASIPTPAAAPTPAPIAPTASVPASRAGRPLADSFTQAHRKEHCCVQTAVLERVATADGARGLEALEAAHEQGIMR